MSQSFQERFKDRMGAVGRLGELGVERSIPIRKENYEPPLQLPGVSALQQVHQSHPLLPFPVLPPRNSEPFQFARPIKVFSNKELSKRYDAVSAPRFTPTSNSLMEGPTMQASEVQSLQDFRAYQRKLVGDVEPIVEAPKPMPKAPAEKPQMRDISPYRAPAAKPPPSDKKSLSADTHPLSHSPASFSPYTLKDYRLIRPSRYMQLGGLGPFMVGTEDWLRKKELRTKRLTYAQEVLSSNMNKFALSRQRESVAQLGLRDARVAGSDMRNW